MKREALTERMELLDLGEKLGWPRLGYGRPTKIPHDKRIPAGQPAWEKFCAHAHVNRILPALRIARVLHLNGASKFHPLTGAEVAHFIDVTAPGDEASGDIHGTVEIGVEAPPLPDAWTTLIKKLDPVGLLEEIG